MDILILGAQNLSFGRPGTAYRHFGTLGPIWNLGDTLGDHGSSRKDTWGSEARFFRDFGLILGPHFESFLSSDGLNSVFFWTLFPGHFLHRFCNGIIVSWGSENKVFARKVLQKPCFRKNRLLVIRGSIFCVFWKPGSRFSEFFCLGNRFENSVFFKVSFGILDGTTK